MTEKNFLSTKFLDEKIQCYTQRCVLLKLHNGDLIKGKAGYYCEDMDFNRDEPDEEFLGWGINLKNVTVNDEKLPYGISIAFADIAGFLPLEGENTEEEIDRIFSRK